jgi:large subunit ribosomal protein L30
MQIKITLVKSLIGAKPAQKATAGSFGFRKPGDSVIVPDDAANRGKVNAIAHLVKVESV